MRDLRDAMPMVVYQKSFVAAQLDLRDGKGRALAYYRGEQWAIEELSDLQMIEFFWALFNQPAIGGQVTF